jgi:RimJ/RimL family protein N-acetyltransferase
MYELTQSDYRKVRALFEGYLNDPMLYATLESNRGGRVFVDQMISPRAACVWTNCEWAYITGGEDDGKFQRELQGLVLEEIIPNVKSMDRDFLSLFSFPDTYPAKLELLFRDQIPLKTKVNTFSFMQEAYFKGGDQLNCLPEGFKLRKIDKQLLNASGNESLKEEIEVYWGSIDIFDESGCGYCVLYRSRMVSWCYVQAYGSGSQTIDIWTDPKYRSMGLGSAVVSAFIEAAECDGYIPFWLCDEANLASRRLAEKVGFKYEGDIELVDIPFRPFDFYRGLARYFFMPRKRYEEAANAYERAFEVKEGIGEDYFQVAIAWAKMEEFGKTLTNIERAIDHGLVDVSVYEVETAFEGMRDSDQWKGLMDRARRAGNVP